MRTMPQHRSGQPQQGLRVEEDTDHVDATSLLSRSSGVLLQSALPRLRLASTDLRMGSASVGVPPHKRRTGRGRAGMYVARPSACVRHAPGAAGNPGGQPRPDL